MNKLILLAYNLIRLVWDTELSRRKQQTMEATVYREGSEKGMPMALRAALPAGLIRLEGALLLGLSALLYWVNGGSWVLFALLLFAPDLSMFGYLAGPRIGAAVYNAFHAYPLPTVLAAYGLLGVSPVAVSVALIWLAHVGMDRLTGYGLKYPSGFKDTHLNRL